MTPALLYLLIAVGLICTELLIMQFTVFWFLFFGLGALITSLLCWAIPELGITAATGIFLLSSIVVSIGLYPVLKKWQDKPSPIAGNDAIGQSAEVTRTIAPGQEGKVNWSGTDWPAKSADAGQTFVVGEMVKIQKLEGIRLIVGS